jgi:hypothetical protein
VAGVPQVQGYLCLGVPAAAPSARGAASWAGWGPGHCLLLNTPSQHTNRPTDQPPDQRNNQIRDRDQAVQGVERMLRRLTADPRSGVRLAEGSRWMSVFEEAAFMVRSGRAVPHYCFAWSTHDSDERLCSHTHTPVSKPLRFAPSMATTPTHTHTPHPPAQATTRHGAPLHPELAPEGVRHPFPWRGVGYLRLRKYKVGAAGGCCAWCVFPA